MGFSSVGARGSASNKTSSATLTISPNANMAAGALLVVWAAWDGAGATANHVSHELGVYDDAGNIYAAIGALDFFAGPGPWTSIHVCQLQHALTTSSVITLRYIGARSVQCCKLWEFALDAGQVWACTDQTPQRLAGSGAILGLTTSLLDSQEYLCLYGLTISGPSTDTINYDAGWTSFTPVGTTGGADASNRTLAGQWKIQTTTTFTTGVTDSTAGRDYCEQFVALCQTPALTTFPATPLLDNFDRANENPLSDGGNWDTVCTPGQTGNTLRLVSDQVATQAGGSDGSWWATQMVSVNAESWVSIPVGVVAEVDSFGRVIVQGGGCTSGNDISGFANQWYKQNATMPGDCAFCGTLGGFGDLSNEWFISYATRANGVRMGLRKYQHVAHQLLDTGGGLFVRTGGVYANQSIYWPWNPTAAKIGISALGSNIRLDDFGGGAWVTPAAGAHTLPFQGVGP